ncbi:hypothetical protein GCM10022223_68320 [Kineosporia mesophila]|uniref:Uncharacterized protein n=1 Tax=Kineosporia mesophila TaxID=566012 RepID=A0ABP7ATJ7_9ACTN
MYSEPPEEREPAVDGRLPLLPARERAVSLGCTATGGSLLSVVRLGVRLGSGVGRVCVRVERPFEYTRGATGPRTAPDSVVSARFRADYPDARKPRLPTRRTRGLSRHSGPVALGSTG